MFPCMRIYHVSIGKEIERKKRMKEGGKEDRRKERRTEEKRKGERRKKT